MAKMTRAKLRSIIKEMAFSPDMGGQGMGGGVLDLIKQGQFYHATQAMGDLENPPSMGAVAKAVFDGFVLDVSAGYGELPGSAEGGTLYAVVQGNPIPVGQVSLDTAISLSRPEFNIVVYPGSLEEF